jgi:hypothetical protein
VKQGKDFDLEGAMKPNEIEGQEAVTETGTEMAVETSKEIVEVVSRLRGKYFQKYSQQK